MRHQRLPALSTLATFEAAARCQGFKSAAAELGVTPGAVSHQIKALEQRLGLVLFERQARGVHLTEAGERLFMVLEHSFDRIAGTLDELQRAGQERPITVAATTAVSSLWFTPRLTGFWRAHPEILVTQHVSDLAAGLRPEADLELRYGDPALELRPVHHLFHDELAAVCSPAFAARHAPAVGLHELAALAALPLIHLDADDTRWTGWESWFAAQGASPALPAGLRVNNYTIALQCARDDAGVVLGWLGLIAPLLERGLLVPLGSWRLPSPGSFYLVCDAEQSLRPEVKVLRDWLTLQH